MDPGNCVSFLTTFGKGNVPEHLDEGMLEEWICGCDNCQDTCPYNPQSTTGMQARLFPTWKHSPPALLQRRSWNNLMRFSPSVSSPKRTTTYSQRI